MVAKLALINIPLNEAKVAFGRMFEYVNIKPENENSQKITISKIESLKASHLFFRFAGHKPIFTDVSFELNRGEIISIVGESGIGKSTISQILEQFYTPEKGEILINGKPNLKEIDLQNWRNLLGIVPQNIHIFNGTVADNICLDNPQSHKEQLLFSLTDYGFIPFIQSLPQGLNTIIGEEGVKNFGWAEATLSFGKSLIQKTTVAYS
ncbi:ATP-binding cassette domain-containing protein [Thermoflexibacter ruber]|uniref:ABC transporter n=1 Tax=Thermoflexibacter ruber TaxID=1003 RepID=A0A1I2HRB8_9BACT|nr:ABC transporter ATP-binding protein [Thermoflexibacter ruber]SFF32088.1 ABC transporter [Thermoflexibacter ruber]